MKTIRVILEKSDEGLFGRIEGRKSYTPVTYGNSKNEVFKNLKDLIKDYQENEKNGDTFWLKMDTGNIQFEVTYDLQSFFKEYDFLNTSAIARKCNLNESLVRQYATGKKFPSNEQVKKIEDTIRSLTKSLQNISLHAV